MDLDHIKRAMQQVHDVQQVQIRPQTMRAMEEATRNLQRIRRRIQINPQIMQEGMRITGLFDHFAMQEHVKGVPHIGEMMRGVNTPMPLNEGAIRAAREVALGIQDMREKASPVPLEQFQQAAENLSQVVNLNLSPQTFASAKHMALQSSNLQSTIAEMASAISRSAPENIRTRYVGTLQQATELLSNVEVKRAIELAGSGNVLREAMKYFPEAGVSFEETVEEEGEGYLDLDLNDAAEALLPYVSWAILTLTIAWAVSYVDPSFAQYKDPLLQVLIWLMILERALNMASNERN